MFRRAGIVSLGGARDMILGLFLPILLLRKRGTKCRNGHLQGTRAGTRARRLQRLNHDVDRIVIFIGALASKLNCGKFHWRPQLNVGTHARAAAVPVPAASSPIGSAASEAEPLATSITWHNVRKRCIWARRAQL